MLSTPTSGTRYPVVGAEWAGPLAQKYFSSGAKARDFIWRCTARLKRRPFKTIYEICSEYSEVFFPIQRSFRSCSSIRQSTRVNT